MLEDGPKRCSDGQNTDSIRSDLAKTSLQNLSSDLVEYAFQEKLSVRGDEIAKHDFSRDLNKTKPLELKLGPFFGG